MGPPQHKAGGGICIEACARPVAVDHRISLRYYYRIANTLLRQANIYRAERNIVDLYIILLRYSSLLCETIPAHRDYYTFNSTEKGDFRKKLIDVLNELESLKPVVRLQIDEVKRGDANDPSGIDGTYGSIHLTKQLTPSLYATQPWVGSTAGSLQKSFFGGRHQVVLSQSVQPDRQLHKLSFNLPYPKEETLSRHSILGPNGLRGQWTGPVTGFRVQYPSNTELTQNDITSLVPATLNQDPLPCPSSASNDESGNNNKDMESVLSLDDGRWSVPVEEPTSVSTTGLQEEFSELNIRQPSPPPVLAEVHPQVHPESRPISPSRVADPRPGDAISDTGRYQSLHVPVTLMECFLRVAQANTAKSLETCGLLAGILKKRTFYVTTLIIPKQKSTSDSCQATNEEEIFEVQDKGSLFTLGWIHKLPCMSNGG